jgi:hypothetical protein
LRVQNGGATIESGTLYANDINTGSLVVRTGGIIFEDDTDAVDILTLRSTLSSASYTQSILRLDVATTSSPASAADFIIGNRAGSATFRVSPFGDVHIGHFADSAASLAAAEYMAIEMDHTGGAETAYFRSHLADMHIVTGHPTIRTISSSLNIEALAATTGNVAGGPSGEKDVSTLKLTYGEQEAMKAIDRSLQKHAFEVGFRAMYIARPDAFRPANIAGLIGSVRQYGSANLNGFKPGFKTNFDYKYQDISGNRLKGLKNKFFDNYINRSYFYDVKLDRAEKEKKPFVLTAEELATMFRFPGRVSETVTLERIEATKAEPPTNLPI